MLTINPENMQSQRQGVIYAFNSLSHNLAAYLQLRRLRFVETQNDAAVAIGISPDVVGGIERAENWTQRNQQDLVKFLRFTQEEDPVELAKIMVMLDDIGDHLKEAL